MTDGEEFIAGLGARVQERSDAPGNRFTVRLDNGIYLRVESFRGWRFVGLRYALFADDNGRPMTLSMSEAAARMAGGLGYRLVSLVGGPRAEFRNKPEQLTRLREIESELGGRDGLMTLSVAVHPERLPVGAPKWTARMQFNVKVRSQGLFSMPDYSEVVQRVLITMDKIGRMLLDSLTRSASPLARFM